MRRRGFALLIGIAGLTGSLARAAASEEAVGSPGASSATGWAEQRPRWELRLTLEEFSKFHSALVGGIDKHGEAVEFELKMAKEEQGLVWIVTIREPILFEVLNYFIAERSADLIREIDPDAIGPAEAVSIRAMQSLIAKVNEAQTKPVWDATRTSGRIAVEGDEVYLETPQGRLRIVGSLRDRAASRAGRAVVAVGVVKPGNAFDLARISDVKPRTLELFVMSLCPFARQAERSLVDYLERHPEMPKPELEVHYIFYKSGSGSQATYSAMHGDAERVENLVQMAIRDSVPEALLSYLRERAMDPEASWETLARRAGLGDRELAAIRAAIRSDPDERIAREYDYVAGVHGIYDGSPSFVWEGARIADLRSIAEFRDLEASAERCAQERR